MLTTRFVFLIVALLAAANASAQETYRWVDQKSGQTIFSDQPPPPGAKQVLKMNGKEQANDQQTKCRVGETDNKERIIPKSWWRFWKTK